MEKLPVHWHYEVYIYIERERESWIESRCTVWSWVEFSLFLTGWSWLATSWWQAHNLVILAGHFLVASAVFGWSWLVKHNQQNKHNANKRQKTTLKAPPTNTINKTPPQKHQTPKHRHSKITTKTTSYRTLNIFLWLVYTSTLETSSRGSPGTTAINRRTVLRSRHIYVNLHVMQCPWSREKTWKWSDNAANIMPWKHDCGCLL